jgi:hypothetical protein
MTHAQYWNRRNLSGAHPDRHRRRGPATLLNHPQICGTEPEVDHASRDREGIVRQGADQRSLEPTGLMEPQILAEAEGRSTSTDVTSMDGIGRRGGSVPIRAWNRIRNNGDALCAIVVDRLFGGAPYHVPESVPHLLGIGSILGSASQHSIVWGTGVHDPTKPPPPVAPRQVRALRGKRSADLLLAHGIALGEVAFGDPGIFADVLIADREPVAASSRRIAVVPHHASTQHPFFAGLAGREDVRIVDMLDDGLTPIRDIAGADIVLSQSLHGLVYAESLGKPSLWISDRSNEVWNFKFQDWFTMMDNPQSAPALMNQPLDDLARQAEVRGSVIQRQALIDAFPSELFQDLDPGRMGYSDCRARSPVLFFHPGALEPTEDFRPDRDLPALAAMSRSLRAITDSLFKRWAERPYAIAARLGAEAIPTPAQSDVIVKVLDRFSWIDQAFVVKSPPTPPMGAAPVALGQGVTLYQNLKRLGDVVYLRPSFQPLTDNFFVFGI